MISEILATAISLTTPNLIQHSQTNLPVIYVEGATWNGEFTVRVLPERRGKFELLLVGTMQAQVSGVSEADRFDAMLTFTVPAQAPNWSVRETQDFALVTFNGHKDVYRISRQQDGVEIWEGVKAPASGSITVFQAQIPSLQVSTQHVAVLFDALFETDNPRSGTCSPNYATCRNDATNACQPHGLAMLTYECDPTTKAVKCSFTCHAPPPGGNH